MRNFSSYWIVLILLVATTSSPSYPKSKGLVAPKTPPKVSSRLYLKAGKTWIRKEWPINQKWRWVDVSTRKGQIRIPALISTIQLPKGFKYSGNATRTKALQNILNIEASPKSASIKITSTGAFDGEPFRVTDQKGKPLRLRMISRPNVKEPFFWAERECIEKAIGAATRAYQFKPKFLFSAIACREDSKGVLVDIVYSRQARLDSKISLKPVDRGKLSGISWITYRIPAHSVTKAVALGTFKIVDRKNEKAYYEAIFYRGVDRFTKMLRIHDKKHSIRLKGADKAFNDGLSALNEGRRSEAIGMFRRSRTLDPKFEAAWWLEIDSLRLTGKTTEANQVQNLHRNRSAKLSPPRKIGGSN